MIRKLFYHGMSWYDAWWRRRHKVEKFDALMSFSIEQYTGDKRIMNDGSWIEPGDFLAILHFNHDCFSAASHNYMRNALRFRKLIFSSLSQLAKDLHHQQKWQKVKALHGISWLPPHGEKFGFLIEPLPDSTLTRMRQFYFRLLLKAFFPQLFERESKRIRPHAYWLTRNNLLKHFSGESAQHELLAHH
jgi:hypothetical protein